MSTTTAAKESIRVICPHGISDSVWDMEWLEKERTGEYVERILAMKREGFVTERGPVDHYLMCRYDSCPKCLAAFAAKKSEALEFMRKALANV